MIDNQLNRKEFKTCVEAMFVSLGGEFTEAALLGYWIALSDCELAQVQAACYRAMRQSKFVPKPAELREFIFGRVEDRGLLAWTDVLKHAAVGAYAHVDFDDQCINATIRSLGGWPDFLSRLTAKEEKFVRAEFLKSYAGFAANGVNGEVCKPLPGLSEGQVVNGALCKPVPRRLGCRSVRLAIGGQEQAKIGAAE